MKKLRVLVLGTGGMANEHVKQFKLDPRVEITGAVDVVPGRAAEFAAAHGIGKSFSDLGEAIAWNGFDAATNVTPDNIHYPTTMQLIAAKKHVLCEKPLAETFPLADEMATAMEKAGLIGMVNLTYRNFPALTKARDMVAKGMLGEIRHFEASYRQSWLVGNHWGDWSTDPKWLWRLSSEHGSKGVLGDVGIHVLDFATHALGQMPVDVQAKLKTFHKAPGDKIGEYPLDANDSMVMTLELPNGALGVLHASRFMTGYDNVIKLHIFGTEGALEVHYGSAWTELRACLGADVHTQAWRQIVSDPVPTNHVKFVDAVLSGKADQPDFRRAADLQKVLDQCFAQGVAVPAGAAERK
jgi:predicted dehydrogenase